MSSIFTPDCTRCVLHKAANSVCIPSSGPDDAGILFYGEGPGAEEDAQNKPFVGQAGGELDDLLDQVGLSRKKVRVSNVVRCRPPANRNPTKDELAACMFYTVQEINLVQPKIIVALGGSALKALTGVQKIGDNRGKMLSLLPEYRSDVPVLACLAPDTLILGADLIWRRIDSLKKGDELVSFDDTYPRKHSGHEMLRGKVLKTQRLNLLCYKITLADGRTVVASEDHLWVSRTRKSYKPFVRNYGWKKTKDLIVGAEIANFGVPWETDDSFGGGYLSGVYDGEGCLSTTIRNTSMSFTQKPGRVWNKTIRLLKKHGFISRNRFVPQHGTNRLAFSGMYQILKFVGSYHPVRFLKKVNNVWERRSFRGKIHAGNPSRIVKITKVGIRPVIGLLVDKHTFLANGLFSHNSYHPAAYLHNPGNKEPYSKAIKEDMVLAQKIASGAIMQKKIITSYSPRSKIKKALKRLSKMKILGCDLEWEVIKDKKSDGGWPWSQRNGKKPRFISIAIAGRDGDKLLSVALKHDDPQIKWIRQILARVPTIFHYAQADLPWLYSMGWDVILGGDTFLKASLLDLDMSKSLKVLVPALTDMEAGWEEDVKVGVWPRTKSEWGRMLLYNGKDSIGTLILDPALDKLMAEQGREDCRPLYEYVLLPSAEVLSRTALNGTPMDEKLLAKKRKKLRKDIVIDTERIGGMLGLPGNYEAIVGKPEKMAPYLVKLGFKLGVTEKTNKPSVTRDILLQNKKVHKVAPLLIKRSKMEKRENSYYRPWTWLLEQQQDHRLHTVYRLTNARTGRSSAESELGNTFQQFPRDKRVRKLIRAKEGWVILAVDQSQIEMRAIAWKSRDRRMLEFFRDGKDLHKAIAGFMKALGKGHMLEWYLKRMERLMKEVTEDERYGAKPINFGLGFGGGPNVIITTGRKDYGITYTKDQAQMGYDAYHQFYPDVRPWQESHWELVHSGEDCITDLGRRRRIEEDVEGLEGVWRKYINTPIQSFASDLSLFCENYTWEILLKEYGKGIYKICENIGFFHDAMLLHVNRREVDLIEGVVLEAWEHPPLERLNVDFDVPLVADIIVDSVWK